MHLHSTMLLLYPRIDAAIEAAKQNLHSTMLLLYPGTVPELYPEYEIYIPLCFYFIQAVRETADYMVFIYIPLCFYFI